MKLKLKHLAPYLPYELKIARLSIDGDFKRIEYSFRATNLVEILRYDNLKPILRPLSDLTKEIEVNGEIFIPLEKLESTFGDCTKLTDTMLVGSFVPFGIVQKLFEWHFDVFNLIENDLAININSLPQSSE